MSVRQYHAHRATTHRWDLAEGPEWNTARGTLTWVDIERGALYESRLVNGTLPDPVLLHQSTSSLGFARAHRDGGWVLGEHHRLSRLLPDGVRVPGPAVITAPDRRINDGAVDPAGSVLAGTLAREPSATECLTRVTAEGRTETLKGDLTLSNGLAFTNSGGTVYLADTLARTIWTADYDSGRAPLWKVAFTLDEYPDGLCADTEGMLWIALWGASEVRRYTPNGTALARVSVPATQVSAVTFAGPQLRTLVITTAAMSVREAEPDAGALFIADVDAQGVPPYLANASWEVFDE